MAKDFRINGFEQIKAFYSWVFNSADKRVTPQHISLYMFLLNQGNRNNWVEWFKCPFDLAMTGACIGNKKTYYSCLEDLVEWKLIQYQKGANEWKAPLIKLEVLNDTSSDTATVPLPTPLPIPLPIPLPTPLPTHIYKLLTDNLKRITDNIEAVVEFLDSYESKFDKDEAKKVIDDYHKLCPGLPQVKDLNKTRINRLRARISKHGIAQVVEAFRLAGSSDFLNGKNERAFRASFDWILKSENFDKIIEGNYSNHYGGSTAKRNGNAVISNSDYSRQQAERFAQKQGYGR